MLELLLTACAITLAQPETAQGIGEAEASPWVALAKYDKNHDGEISAEEYPRGEKAFTNLDKNRDGVISPSDFEPQGESGGHDMSVTMAGMLASRADRDKDGKVTQEEFIHYVEKLDVDANGVLEPEEMAAAFGSRARRMQPGTLARMTRGLDTDRDGDLQATEIAALFGKLDADVDGVLDPKEMPERRPSRGRRSHQGENSEPPAEVVPQVGEVAPDFELPVVADMEKTIKLSSFQGEKPVALIFGSFT